MLKKEKTTSTRIITAFRQGREKGFTTVYREFFPALCLYAFRITSDQAASEDIVEEVFIRTWDRRAGFYQFPVLKSYLYTAVRNSSLNWLKAHKKWSQIILSDISSDLASTKLDDLITAETFRELYTAMDKLPSQSRQIINLLFMDGKKTSQVAGELGLSVAHVSTQKKRGLLLLRKYLPDNLFLVLLILFLK